MNIRTSAFRGLAILSLTAFGMAACEDKDVINIPEPDPDPVEVTVAPTQVTILVGGTASAAAVVKNVPTGGANTVTWASANTAVATVSAAGVITGVAPGSTIITATSAADANAKGLVSVIVEAPIVTLSVLPTTAGLITGGTLQLAATVSGTANQAVTWGTSAAGVATVSATGLVTAVAPGTAVITATAAANTNVKASSVITVTAPTPPNIVITLEPAQASTTVGGTVQLVPNVTGTTNTNVTYVSSAPTVATVHATNGLVSAVAVGTVVITATSAADVTKKAASIITVTPKPPVTVTVAPAAVSLNIDQTVQLVPTVTGTDSPGVTYVSSDATVATVTAAGLVTAKNGGTAVITVASVADPTKTATSVITVAGPPPEASISIASVVDHESGAPVNPLDIEGQIDVTVNVSAVPENDVRAVVVFIDDQQVCRQNFSTPLGTTQGVATINCPVNTAEVVMPGYDPKFMNGEHTIFARALDSGDDEITTAEFCPVGTACKVIFDNEDFVGDISLAFENTVGNWHGGDVTVNVEFVQFSLDAIEEFSGALLDDCDTSDGIDGFFLAFSNGVWTGTTTAAGTFPDACVVIGDVEYETMDDAEFEEFSDEFDLDNEAPYIDDSPNVSSGLYYNDAKTITATVDDYGVDSEDPNTIIEIRSGSTVVKTGAAGASVTTAGLAETALNVGYKVYVYGKDALGNESWHGPYGNFGIDFTEPTVTYSKANVDGDSISGKAVNTLDNPVVFTFSYIDAATPPAGPAGFNPNPVTYSIVHYDATYPTGHTVESGAVNTTFDLDAGLADGYYVVNATVTDAAGNTWAMPAFTILVDDTPPYIGTLTVPSVLTGGTAYTMSAQITDNVDLGEGWATIGYNHAVEGMDYWLIQQKTDLGAYGLPLNTNMTLGTLTIPSVVRSIRPTDPASNLAGAVVYTAKTAEYSILDVAGETIPTLCPVTPALDDAVTANCRVRTADIGPAYNVGNPTGVTSAWTVTGLLGLGTPGASGFRMDGTTGAIDATATGAAQTFNNPFAAVYFYGVDATGRAHFLGTGSVSVTDDTILQIRTWRYTLATSWTSAYAAYTGGVFALVYGSNGDALVTVTEAHP